MRPAAIRALVASPVVLLLLAAARLLLVSNYNTATASSIAASGGFTGTLLGSTMPLMPLFLPVIFLLLIVAWRIPLALIVAITAFVLSPAHATLDEAWRTGWDAIVSGWTAVVDGGGVDWLLAADIQLKVLMAICAVFIVSSQWRAFAGEEFEETDGSSGSILAKALLIVGFFFLYAVAIAISLACFWTVTVGAYAATAKLYVIPERVEDYSTTLRRPWLPAEEVALSGGQVEVAYVISTKDGWIQLLREQDRTIRYVKSTAVEARTVCQVESAQPFRRPVFTLSQPPGEARVCKAVGTLKPPPAPVPTPVAPPRPVAPTPPPPTTPTPGPPPPVRGPAARPPAATPAVPPAATPLGPTSSPQTGARGSVPR